MKYIFYSLVLFAAFSIFTSCATIVGGNKYWAHVEVPNHPNANIKYNNEVKGKGSATFKVKRTQAKMLSILVKDEGCDEQTFNFTKNAIRGWSFTYYIIVPFPLSLLPAVVDLANGAFVKPNVKEIGVSKIDYKNFQYTIKYNGCKK